jgi:hypothetical protein
MDQETETKLTYEEKKKTKEDEREKARAVEMRKKKGVRLFKFFIWIAIILLIGYGVYVFVQKSLPQGEDMSQAISLMESARHIQVGESHEPYNSNPGTSGPHYAQTARSGFRGEAISDEHIVHNLEHGDIWISFHPRVSDETKKQLKKFGAAKVIITPREANDTDVALAAWGRLDTFNLEDDVFPEQRIRDFINRYINKGPEKVPGMSGGI